MSTDPDGVVDPYAPPRIGTGAEAPSEGSEAISRAELEAFVGKNGRVYWDLLGHAVGSRSPFIGLNVAAAALPLPWLLYRKMYVEFIVASVMGLAARLGLALAMVADDDVARPTLAPVYLLLALVVGTAGNGLYLRRIRSAVLELRRAEPDRERRLPLLTARGGTSWLAPLLLVLLSAASVLLFRVWFAERGGLP